MLAAALLTGCGDSDNDSAKKPTPTPTPAETRSPAVATGKAEGDLAVGLTEQNPNLFWAPVSVKVIMAFGTPRRTIGPKLHEV